MITLLLKDETIKIVSYPLDFNNLHRTDLDQDTSLVDNLQGRGVRTNRVGR